VWHELQVPTPLKTVLPAAMAEVALVVGVVGEAAVVLVELELDGLPGTPGWAALVGGVPIGGGAFAGWAASHDWNWAGWTTYTVERISECPAPHSSVHSTG
jgi:hypothetical protein